MTAQNIWQDFKEKLINDKLCEEDFLDEMRALFSSFFIGEATKPRRVKYATSPVEYYDTVNKSIIFVKCSDDNYRFDFIKYKDTYKLAFIECITLPVSNLNPLPFSEFLSLPDKECEIRCEKAISKTIFFYNKFKELLGKHEALKIFLDGSGELLCAKSWVPFYSDKKSYIAYAAWIENRINGETTILEEFTEERCIVRFKNHLWRRMYTMTAHLKFQIEYDEYIELFEAIWKDRATQSCWKIEFIYKSDDTVLVFTS